eukprot:TRINITY_DN39243_c0_g1_i1.p1 TRINITY_DN39243_c0_g1~~TRINITY_DN39243_c0_g1_i1.p1  ORF type:complete len:184 (+),score=26.91 TRINITY_DN39243_c0_g1_i1:64-615(+)
MKRRPPATSSIYRLMTAQASAIALWIATFPMEALSVGVSIRRTRGIFDFWPKELAEKECTCQCCIAELRRPQEMNAQINAKCTPPPEDDQRNTMYGCTTRCSVVNDPIFPSSSVVEYNRYCFYHCKPTASVPALLRVGLDEGPEATMTGGNLLDADCVAIRGQAVLEATNLDHNGRDPEASTG